MAITIDIALHPDPSTPNSVAELIERARRIQHVGIDRLWVAQLPTTDAVTLATAIAAAVPGLRTGTSVVTLNPRNPLVVGVQARIAQAAGAGFALGIGLGAAGIEEAIYGISDDTRVRRLAEYLDILDQVRRGGPVSHEGQLYRAVVDESIITGGNDFELHVAAMGPQALRVAARYADGILPYLAGPKALESFIVPTLREAAEQAERPTPQVISLVALVVTDDAGRVRQVAREQLEFYGTIPSYRSVLDREGVANPEDVALIGTEDEVRRQLERLREAGVDSFIATNTGYGGPEDEQRTWEFLGALNKS